MSTLTSVRGAEPWRRRLFLPAYTVRDAARYAHVSPQTVGNWHYRQATLGAALPGREQGEGLVGDDHVEVRNAGARDRKHRGRVAPGFELVGRRSVEPGVPEHRVEQQLDRGAARAPDVEAEDLSQLALGIHVDGEHAAAAVQRQIGRQIDDQRCFCATALLVDEGDATRTEHSTPPGALLQHVQPAEERQQQATNIDKGDVRDSRSSPLPYSHTGGGVNRETVYQIQKRWRRPDGIRFRRSTYSNDVC